MQFVLLFLKANCVRQVVIRRLHIDLWERAVTFSSSCITQDTQSTCTYSPFAIENNCQEKWIFKLFIYCVSKTMRACCVHWGRAWMCHGTQNCGSQFSPFTEWVPGIGLSSAGLAASIFTYCTILTNQDTWLFKDATEAIPKEYTWIGIQHSLESLGRICIL